MQHYKNHLKATTIILLGLVIAHLLPISILHAQDEIQNIELVDLTGFPQVMLRVQHQNGLSLSEINNLVVVENAQPIQTTTLETTPIRVAFLLDVWQEKFPAELSKLIVAQMKALSAEISTEWHQEHDLMAVYVPGNVDGRQLTKIRDWTSDIPQIIQDFDSFPTNLKGSGATERTAINQLIVDVLNEPEFAQDNNSQKFLVLVSNGQDGYTKNNRDDLERILTSSFKNNVRIIILGYPPQFVTVVEPEGKAHLEELAIVTGPDLYTLGDDEEVKEIKKTIVASRQESILLFTSNVGNLPLNQEIWLQNQDGQQVSNPLSLTLEPINVSILPQTLEPVNTGESIEFKVTIADRENPLLGRAIADGAEFWLNKVGPKPVEDFKSILPVSDGDPPSYRITIPIEATSNAELSVRLLGAIPGLFAPQTFSIGVAVPPATKEPMPEATVEPPPATPTPQSWFDQLSQQITDVYSWRAPIEWLAILLAIVGLLIILWLVWRLREERRRKRVTAGGSTTGTGERRTYDPTTRPWNPEQGAQPPKAELVLIQGEGLLPGLITLREESIIFGSERRQVDILLIDRYVSQEQFSLHEGNGHYRIQNLSATNYTQVNGADIPSGVMTLRSGDVIQFGPVKYRYLSNVLGSRVYREHDWYVSDITPDDLDGLGSSPRSGQTAPVAPLPPRHRGRTASRTRSSSWTGTAPPSPEEPPAGTATQSPGGSATTTDAGTQASVETAASSSTSGEIPPTGASSSRGTPEQSTGSTAEVPPKSGGRTAAVPPPKRGGGTGDVPG